MRYGLMALCAAGVMAADEPARREAVGWHFAIQVPLSATVACENQFYSVALVDGRLPLGLYAGDVIDDQWEGHQAHSERVGPLRVQVARWADEDGKHMEAVVFLQREESPRYLHVWYHGLPDADATVAEGMVRSIRYIKDDAGRVRCTGEPE